MVISIWPSRPTMRERAPSTRRTEFPAFERRATTYKKFRMRTTGQVRGDFRQGLRCVPDPSARTKILPAASFSPTTESSRTIKSFSRQNNLIARGISRNGLRVRENATEDNAEARSSQRFAEIRSSVGPAKRDLVLVPGVYSFRAIGARF
jgi:hypothetical protein